jgi:hypothetical protein
MRNADFGFRICIASGQNRGPMPIRQNGMIIRKP